MSEHERQALREAVESVLVYPGNDPEAVLEAVAREVLKHAWLNDGIEFGIWLDVAEWLCPGVRST